MKITYSIFLVQKNGSVPFSDLSEEDKAEVANYIRRTPLETLGEVKERKTA